MIFKHPKNGSTKGIFTLVLPNGHQGKLLKRRFWQLQESNCFYSLLMSLSSQWQSVDVFQQSLCEVILDPLWDDTGA